MVSFSENDCDDSGLNGIEMENKQKKSFVVNFNNLLKVVLIPSREEYRSAQCDLWWSGNDFNSFKQSARSEIKLLAVFENICMTEARRKLYQPGHPQCDNNEEDSYYSKDDDSESQMETKPMISKKQTLHTVSSIACLSNVVQTQGLTDLLKFDECIDDESEVCLSLCVPLEEPGVLSTKERPSRKTKSPLTHTILTVISIASFALPLFGYYYVYFN